MENNKKYVNTIIKALQKISDDVNIKRASELIADAYENKNKVYTFGSGHSHMIGEELYARAGGWNYIIPVIQGELTLTAHPFKSTYIERMDQYADLLMGLYEFKDKDVIIITSNSGRNNLTVEFALRLKKVGVKIIAITSKEHTNSVKSRHKSGKKLIDVADVVIDNLAPPGDATTLIDDNKVGPISTITGSTIANLIIINTFEILGSRGIKRETLVSSNLDGQDDRNKKLLK